jgi:Protein of unknown function (DUF429)
VDQIIAGVDFSGARAQPNDTWVTVAKVGALGVEVLDVRKIGAHILAKTLSENAQLKAIGVNCPFSLPVDFIQYLAAKRTRPDYQSWQELVQDLVFMNFEEFMQIAKEFKKEPKRFTDEHCIVPALSPMHRTNPQMIQLVFHCMRMLAMLDPARFSSRPLQDPVPLGCSMLEINPRATLHVFGITETGYKNQEKADQDRMQATRTNMLKALLTLREKKGISFQNYPRLSMVKRWEKQYVESDQALDSLIAAYTAAAWMVAPQLFDDPLSSDNLDVLFEGWTYTLKPPSVDS